MSDIIDFLKLQQEHLRKLKEQAEQAVKDAEKRYVFDRSWEHGEPPAQEIAGPILWPWAERPWDLPVSAHELDLALKFANLNSMKAARILKVDMKRMELILQNSAKFKYLAKRLERAANQAEPVSAYRQGNQLTIKVRKPAKSGTLQIGFDDAGNLVIIVESNLSATTLELVKKAAELEDKNGKKH